MKMIIKLVWAGVVTLLLLMSNSASCQEQLDLESAVKIAEKTVRFYREKVGVQGGYIFSVSDDLKHREGENRVGPREVWIEPPATPAVGMLYLRGWQLTRLSIFRDAMLETADALIRGQLESGGWADNIEYDSLLRPKYAYRVDHRTTLDRRFNRTTFDDDKSQSALKFLMLLDRELKFEHASLHEAALTALDSFQKTQYPNGAWPQQYSEFPDPKEYPVTKARFPRSWSREFPKESYRQFYTLNDNTICDLIDLMLTAYFVYEDDRWLESAQHGGDFLLLAQLPEPQPGWAQQYNRDMEPVWARKFEPPAITGGESQQVMRTLLNLYDVTGDEKYLRPLPRVIGYYRSLQLEDGGLARFYEMGTDKPLYFTTDYKLVYHDNDLPTHYGFKVSSKIDSIERQYQKLKDQGASHSSVLRKPKRPRMDDSLRKSAERIVGQLDKRGAWVEDGELKKHPKDEQSGRIISTQTYLKNLFTLIDFINASLEK